MATQPILIIIINWRQPHVTVECIQSLQRMDYSNKDFLIIDNGSGDNSTEIFQEKFPHIPILELPNNLGFAKGANLGLNYAIQKSYPYALLINNDAFPKIDMLSKLYTSIESDIALLSPKIFYEAEPNRIWFAGGQRHSALLELRGRGQKELDSHKWNYSRDVDYLLGTCLLVNLSLVSQLNFFDDRYFMYYEDLDLSLRCQLAGFRLRIVSDAHLFHRVSVSLGGENSPSKNYMIAKSSIIFFHTHAAHGIKYAILLYRTFSALKRVLILFIQGNQKAASAYLSGLQDGWHLIKTQHLYEHNTKNL